MHGVHDGVPFRRAIQQAHRRYSRPGRTQYSAQQKRWLFPQTSLRHISLREAVAAAGSSHADLPTLWPAETGAGYWFAAVVTEASGTNGSPFATRAHRFFARPARAGRTHYGASAQGWYALRVRATGLLPTRERGHCTS